MGFNLDDLLSEEYERTIYRIQTENGLRVVDTLGERVKQVRSAVPGLILTGGAVRDTYFNRPVKDLDFITARGSDKDLLATFLGRPLTPCIDPELIKEYAPDSGQMLLAYETDIKDVNLLYVRDIWVRISEFPDSISQCWTDGEYMYGTPDFMETTVSKTVTLTATITPERLARLKAKYPDFEYEAA